MAWTPPTPPAPLEKHHLTGAFESGAEELDTWLRQYAWVNHTSGNARVFVAARDDLVVGYYALAAAGVEKAEAPGAVTKGGAPTQVPLLLLARLAVDRDEQGHGLGRGLLVDAIRRATHVADNVGFRALIIHARDDDARQFYRRLGGFVESPTDPLHLFLPLKEVRRFTG